MNGDHDFDLYPGKVIPISDYTCSADNMFGLKRVIIYNDTVIAVFDKDRFDKPKLSKFHKDMDPPEDYPMYDVTIPDTIKESLPGIGTTVTDDERICVLKYSCDSSDTVTSITILGRKIRFSDDNLCLSYREDGVCDAIITHEQTFDKETGTWGTEEVYFHSELEEYL